MLPHFWENGSGVGGFACYAMHTDVPIIEIVGFWMDKRIEVVGKLTVSDNYDANSTDAGGLGVGGFKINGCKVFHCNAGKLGD